MHGNEGYENARKLREARHAVYCYAAFVTENLRISFSPFPLTLGHSSTREIASPFFCIFSLPFK